MRTEQNSINTRPPDVNPDPNEPLEVLMHQCLAAQKKIRPFDSMYMVVTDQDMPCELNLFELLFM